MFGVICTEEEFQIYTDMMDAAAARETAMKEERKKRKQNKE